MADDARDGSDSDLRLARPTDVRALTALIRAAYSGYTTLLGRTPLPMLTDFASAIVDHDVWVVETGGTIVAAIELVPFADHLWLDNVAVHPGWQGRGIGRRLLGFAESEARRRGLAEVRLLTNERYVANIAMYERHGYRETHREPHRGTDLVHFRKELDSE